MKLCQTCYFFRPIVFDYEDEYYHDEDLGIFTLWIWKGYCLNEANPNKFPAFYHKTKSNKKCEWYITKKEYEQLTNKLPNKELTYIEFKKEVDKIRCENEEN